MDFLLILQTLINTALIILLAAHLIATQQFLALIFPAIFTIAVIVEWRQVIDIWKRK